MRQILAKVFWGLTLLLIALSLPLGAVCAQGGAETGFFESYELQPGSRIEVPLTMRNVQDLYAIDVEIQFDPALLSVEDANPGQAGVQPALGTFLDAGLTLFNEVDNQAGTVKFAMSQVNPSEPKSGEGVVLVLYYTALAEGESDLTVSFVELSDRLGEAIPVTAVDSSVSVFTEAEEKAATPIPVGDPGQIIIVPTLMPTPTSVQAEGEVAVDDTVDSGNEVTDQGTADVPDVSQQEDAPEAEDQEAQGFSLLRYWWLVLIVVLAAVGMAVYLLKSKK